MIQSQLDDHLSVLVLLGSKLFNPLYILLLYFFIIFVLTPIINLFIDG